MRASARTTGWWAVVLAATGLAWSTAGCDWRDFDNLQNRTPVLRVGAPSGYSSQNDFGRIVLAVEPPADGTVAARFIVAASEASALAVVDLSPEGEAKGSSLMVDGMGGSPIASMAEVPGAGKVLLGLSSLGGGSGGSLAVLPLVAPFDQVTIFTMSAEPQFGIGVASAALGATATADYVVVSGSAVHVFPGGAQPELAPAAASAACPISLATTLPSDERANRAVVTGKLLAGGGVQIAVGTPASSSPGSVSFFSSNAAAGTVDCASGSTLTSPSGESQFGRALAVGDFDGDGNRDLLVGAPPSRAYLYLGPIAPGAQPTVTIPAATGAVAFGASVAAVNPDGKAADEALVADPDAAIGGSTEAGNATLYSFSASSGTMKAVALAPTLGDASPGNGEVYGSSVAGLPFCATSPCASPAPRLPLVGSASHVFVYFTFGAVDPRAK